jgi:hypothetical protein
MMSGQTFEGNRDDPRRSNVFFSTWDEESLIENAFLLTNNTVYALSWSKRPSSLRNDCRTRAYLYPLTTRKTPFTIHDLSIVYEKRLAPNNFSAWMVSFLENKKTLLSLYHLGHDQDANFISLSTGEVNATRIASPRRLSFGFGISSYLQMVLWGQGISLIELPCAEVYNNQTPLYTTDTEMHRAATLSIHKISVDIFH